MLSWAVREEEALMLSTAAIVVGALVFIVSFTMSLDDRRMGPRCLAAMVIGTVFITLGTITALAP